MSAVIAKHDCAQTGTVSYFKVDGIDGDYFTCARYGTMSIKACGRNYVQAPTAHKCGKLEACIGCETGAVHVTGLPMTNDTQPSPAPTSESIAYQTVCVRCRRGGAKDHTRLLGRMRLIRHRTICVSCYNREREVLRGKNAKGAKPQKRNTLYRTQVARITGGAMQVVRFEEPVFDCVEAIFTVLRRTTTERPSVGWTAAVPFRKETN